MKRLYLDVEGVLLGKSDDAVIASPHAGQFLEFALNHFECYWLASHEQGDSTVALAHLAPHVPADLLRKLRAVRPTRFAVLKTEAMAGDFYWIDDSPLAAEVTDLCRRGAFDRWIEVNTRIRPDDLLRAMGELCEVLSRRPAPPAMAGTPMDLALSQMAAAN